jgi:hypothetical protein
VIVTEAFASRVRPLTVSVWPETPTLPADAVVKPFAEEVVDGADQPTGRVT